MSNWTILALVLFGFAFGVLCSSAEKEQTQILALLGAILACVILIVRVTIALQ